MERCIKCNEWIFEYKKEGCRCKPFKVYYPEYFGDEKETRYGYDFENIAEKLAMYINEGENECNTDIFESPVEIEDMDGNVKYFQVYAEPEINYYPKEVEPKETNNE